MTSNGDHPRKRQADAMARAQAWVLVTHQCAYHEVVSDVPKLSQENLINQMELTGVGDEGAMALVLVALGDVLDEITGDHLESIRLVRERRRDGEHIAVTVAELIAARFGGSAEAAYGNALRAQEEGQFWGLLADDLTASQEGDSTP